MATTADTQYTRLEEEEAKPIPHIEVPLAPRPSPPAQVKDPRGRCFVHKAYCCLSLPTGVRILASLDMIVGVCGILAAILAVVAHTLEKAFDGVAESALEHAWGNSTNATIEIANAISKMNHDIDLAWRGLPVVLVVSGIMLYFAVLGFRAAAGNERAALVFYYWKACSAVATMFSCSIFHALLAIYAAIICRSHWINVHLSLPVVAIIKNDNNLKEQPPVVPSPGPVA